MREIARDVNCAQHIPGKLDAADVSTVIAKLQVRLTAIEAENAPLRANIKRSH